MLETPLTGRFVKENQGLVFAPPSAYFALINGTLAAGCAFLALGAAGTFGLPVASGREWWFLMTGGMVVFAAIFANLSLARISFDLRERTYRRRQGPGLLPQSTYGSLSRLEAILLLSELNARSSAGTVTYHLVLYWKGGAEPLMVLQNETYALTPGQPLNFRAGALYQAGMHYAKVLGVPFADRSSAPSPCPVPLF